MKTKQIVLPNGTKMAICDTSVIQLIEESIKEEGVILELLSVRFNKLINNMNIQIEYAFGCGGTLYMNNDYTGPIKQEFGYACRMQIIPEISWSGTSRSLAEAILAVDTYQKLISLAARITAKLEQWQYYYHENEE